MHSKFIFVVFKTKLIVIQLYRSHCEILTKALNECKTQFFSTKVIESENDKKELFSVAKTLLGNVKKYFLPDSGSDDNIANSFNDYFINNIITICEDLTKSATVSAVSEIKEKLFPTSNLDKLSSFTPTT